MIDRCQIRIAVVVMAVLANLPIAAAHSPDPDSPRYKAVVALSDFLISTGDKALKDFVDERVSPTLLGSIGRDRLVSALDELRSGFSGAQMAGARPQGPYGAFIRFSNDQSISFETEANPPHRYVRIGSIGGEGVPSTAAPACAIPQQTSDVASLAQLDETLRAEAAAETFSGVVLVAKDGKPIFHEAYGYADKKAGVLNRKDTKFNLGSINKLFTMVAVYQLLDAGKLNLDDTVGKYLPQFPPAVANNVTVGHLLEHRSGWGAYWENPTWNARRRELRSLDDYMAFIKDIPLDFEPGSRMQYSNTGYEVLGAIVEK
ncbi:MAG: serine hydrolase domain-containing protein, partial [Gemmatimonadales bacterium]